ncbi:N-acetyltransferase [Paenibacillus sp. UNC499MF]|uniref:GNAT family N-acetyltransferase n=1 Tax=Paenibacillus sp. UNC499MF TaxID=1502751 RepID=UPI0008A00A74|nr:GNAT family N-acetyltransferase [Paenibacillus sp. UNC499MF]SEG67387.1 Acetyltransferase (GNAT) family protein [Paenibacillus sp. UNC499MF]
MPTMILLNEQVNSEIRANIAGMEEYPEIERLMVDTAKWLRSKGSTQWSGLLSGSDDHDMAGALERGEVVVFKGTEGTLLACVILQQEPAEWDRNLWRLDPGETGTAVYLHRLVVERGQAGRSLGRTVMDWIGREMSFPGKDRIRLDCIAGNETLNAFYKNCGYTYIGESGGFSLYEFILP